MPNEATIRDNACAWLNKQGAITLKLELLRRRGFPDVLVLMPFRQIWFIEFKTPKGKQSPIQKHVQQLLEAQDFHVSVHTSLKDVQEEYELVYRRTVETPRRTKKSRKVRAKKSSSGAAARPRVRKDKHHARKPRRTVSKVRRRGR